MFRALLAHPQEASQAALGILNAYYDSWLHLLYMPQYMICADVSIMKICKIQGTPKQFGRDT
jgi:hypothetical protein